MTRELKIIVSFFLVFFLFGLQSFFNSGEFITIIFLEKTASFIISIVFFVLNRKEVKAYFPGIVMILYSIVNLLMDEFSMQYYSQKFGVTALYQLSNEYFLALFAVIVVGFTFLVAQYYYWKSFKHLWSSALIFLAFSMVFGLEFTENPFDESIAAVFFFGALIVFSNYKTTEPRMELKLMNYQFLFVLLLLLLDIFSRFSFITKSFS